jgi:type II secretory pathway pseudopilin PulG
MCARHPRPAAGFSYVGIIVLVAIIGLVGATALKTDALARRAAAEQELLETGAGFICALDSYAAVTPEGQSAQPPTLQELVADQRFPVARHHLRKIPVDPATGKTEWGLIYKNTHVGIIGVYSLANAKPLKRTNFSAQFPNFENKAHLSDWVFMASATVSDPAQPERVNGDNPP